MEDEFTPEMLQRLVLELGNHAITMMSIEEVEQLEQEYREYRDCVPAKRSPAHRRSVGEGNNGR